MTGIPSVRLTGLTLGSRAPRRAAEWYRHAFDLTGNGDRLFVGAAGGVDLIVVRRPALSRRAQETGRIIPTFAVDDAEALEERLIAGETAWVRELENGPWGRIGTVLDGDGNVVQFLERPRSDRHGGRRSSPAPNGRRW